jgi:hypothetical protein
MDLISVWLSTAKDAMRGLLENLIADIQADRFALNCSGERAIAMTSEAVGILYLR